MDGGSMHPENPIIEGGAFTHARRNPLEPQGRRFLEGSMRERGGGSGSNSEIQMISVEELLKTISKTTSDPELIKLRVEKKRRIDGLLKKLGSTEPVMAQIEKMTEQIISEKPPGKGEDFPDRAKEAGKDANLDQQEERLLQSVIEDEARARYLASPRVPEALKLAFQEENVRQRVTKLSGLPVEEYKSEGSGGKGILIGQNTEQPTPAIPVQENTEAKRQAKTSMDYFRANEDERVNLTTGFSGEYAEVMDRSLIGDPAAMAEITKRTTKAREIGLNRVVANEVVEIVADIEKKDRGFFGRVAAQVEGRVGEIEEVAQNYLNELISEKKITVAEAQKLGGYASVSAIKQAAKLRAQNSLNPSERSMTSLKLQKTGEGELGLNWAEVIDEAGKRAGGETKDLEKRDDESLFGKLLGAEVFGEYISNSLMKFLHKRESEIRDKRAQRGKEVEGERPKEEPAKQPEVQEPPKKTETTTEKEREFANFEEAYSYLEENWRRYDVMTEDERRIFDKALRVKREAVEKVSRHGTNDYGKDKGLFDNAKAQISRTMHDLIDDDDYWLSVQNSGLAREDVIDKLARAIEPIKNNTQDGNGIARGIKRAWFDGVARQWRIAELMAENKLGLPGYRGDQIKELQKEQEFLGWGAVSTQETQMLIDSLADRSVLWRVQNEPTLRQWWIDKNRRDLGLEEGQVQGVDNVVRTEDGKVLLIEQAKDIPEMFSSSWLKARGLPEKVYIKLSMPAQRNGAVQEVYKVRDMRLLCYELLSGVGMEGFEPNSIKFGLEAEEEERAKAAGEEPNYTGIMEQASDAYNHFLWGDYRVMQMIQRETNGSLRAWVGPDGKSGFLNELNPNMKWIAHQMNLDPGTQSAMRVWTALGGTANEDYRNIAGMTREERAIVDSHYARFKDMMKVKEYKRLTRGARGAADELMSRKLGEEEMNQVEEEMVRLGMDRGAVKMTRMIADLIVWTPESTDARKQYANFQDLLQWKDKNGRIHNDSKANRSLIGRTLYKDGPTFADDLRTGGIESLLSNIEGWSHASQWLTIVYGGLPEFFKQCQLVEDIRRGNDEFANFGQRKNAVTEIVQKLMAHREFAPMDDETADAWVSLKLPTGIGTHAARRNFTPSEKRKIRSESNGAAWESVIREVPIVGGLLGDLFRNTFRKIK